MNPAREKIEREGACRACRLEDTALLDAAHVIPRSLVPGQGFTKPEAVVPLCSRIKGAYADCHGRYDSHTLDLLPLLSLEEQAAAVELVGIVGAFRQITGDRLHRHEDVDVWGLT